MEKLSDERTIQMIRENPYMQYFLGLSGFTKKEVFNPSLFVYIRKRLGVDAFDQMTQSIIELAIEKKIIKHSKQPVQKKEKDDQENESSSGNEEQEAKAKPKNQGRLKLDATVADAFIKYPTDLDILNDSREKSEELIDFVYEDLQLKLKPRTYRRKARKSFLTIAKKKNKSKKEIRKGIRQQLGYLNRNIKHLYDMLDKYDNQQIPFNNQQYKYLLVIQEVYRQQFEMYKNKVHSCSNRIVSIHQPHVRPIVRGKAKANVEFGAKIGVSLREGYSRIDTLSWEAYNESTDLQKQCENYKNLFGYYPELVQVDGIYLNRENRKWLKDRNIRTTGKSLGRPLKEELTTYQKRKRKKEEAERNHIEGKFGQGKNGYNLNKIRARLQDTSESWIAGIFFIMNLVRFSKDLLFGQIFSSLEKLFCSLKRLFNIPQNKMCSCATVTYQDFFRKP